MRSHSLLHRLAPAALLLMASGALAAAVDQSLLDMAPPDTRVLFGLEVQQALASPFGHFALSRMPEQSASLLHFAATTGFDLRRDLRELLLASSSGMRGKPVKNGVILARGVFERGIFEAGKLSALAGNMHARVSSYAGVPLIVPADPGSGVIAILDGATLAVGGESAVEGVIRRRQQRFLFSGPLADKARAASVNTDMWMATVTPLEDLISAAGGPWPSTFAQAVTESAAGLRFDNRGVTLSAEVLTRSASEAVALAGMFKIVAGMVKGPAAALLQNARFTSEGPIARATLTIAEQDLENAFPAPVEGRAAR
jgi:hypothetical protein